MMDYTVNKDDMMELLENTIRMTVRETVIELRKTGFLQAPDKQTYKSVSEQLYLFYSGKNGLNEQEAQRLHYAIVSLEDDPYIEILPLYYGKHLTVEDIAEIVHCDASTVTRNKKRLCLVIHNILLQN